MTGGTGEVRTAPLTLADWFRRGLAVAPDGAALRIGDESWRYTELAAAARPYVEAIGDASHSDDPPVVGVLAARSIECYAGMLGAFVAGSVVVPLNPGFPPQRTAAMAHAAGVGVVIADSHSERAAKA